MKIFYSTKTTEAASTEEMTTVEIPSKVVLFNDDWHTFEEVIFQLIKALRCSKTEAQNFALEVHFKGKAIVFSGGLMACLNVTTILEEIALHTQIIT